MKWHTQKDHSFLRWPQPIQSDHAKVKKWIFEVHFPGNWFEFGIIVNDFWSFTIWAIQISVSFAGFKNPKIPGIQPNDTLSPTIISDRQIWCTLDSRPPNFRHLDSLCEYKYESVSWNIFRIIYFANPVDLGGLWSLRQSLWSFGQGKSKAYS